MMTSRLPCVLLFLGLALPPLAGETMPIADVAVVDQTGAPHRFYSDLVKDRIVAINFVFTSCTTICPTMGATFARVQKILGDHGGGVSLISVSIDPNRDTPPRLAAWSAKLGGKPGWTLVTGRQSDIDRLLKSLGVFTPDKYDHGPIVMIGDDRAGTWQRINALAPPATLVSALEQYKTARAAIHKTAAPAETKPSAAAQYFGHLPLVDQDGKSVELYDLMRGRTAVINSLFANCQSSCPVMAAAFAAIQQRYTDRLGKDLVLISITVDPENDTPPRLQAFGKRFGAKPGWYFLTGTAQQVDAALARLGLRAQNRDGHSNVLLVGNDRTGLWKKVLGVAGNEAVVAAVGSVVNDTGEPPPATGAHPSS